jgi:predicted RNA-binding protein associated with RNAse of E/G family
MNVCQPTSDRKTIRYVEKARKTNQQRDATERASGNAAPSDCPLDVELRTVLTALFVGLEQQNWSIIAEGIAMLQDTELKVRRVISERVGHAGH